MAKGSCADHPSVLLVARCSSCTRGLCNDCYRFRTHGKPACARCAYEASTRRRRRVSLATAFVALSWGGAFWATRRFGLWPEHAVLVSLTALAAPVLAYLIAASAGDSDRGVVERRDPGEDAPIDETVLAGSGSPFRAGVRRVVLAASPSVSGSATVLVVGASMIGSAVLLPASVKLPRWVEAEAVLGIWWVIVLVTVTALLYRGFRLADDYVYFLPWDRPVGVDGTKRSGGSSNWLDGCSLGEGCGAGDLGEGLLGALVVAVALAVAFALAWVFVELAMPVIFLLMYWLLMKAIGRAARDRRECKGSPVRSLAWGAAWATLYVVPLALATLALHLVHGRHAF